MLALLWIALSFAIGSIPFGVIIARTWKGVDPRASGSRNPGSANVARLCGLPCGMLTLACDVLKGVLPVWAATRLDSSVLFHQAVVLAAVGGHVKSPFLNFRGGKGVATAIGALLPLGVWPLLCACACALAVIAASSFVSLGALTAVTLLVFFQALFGRWDMVPLSFVLMLALFWTHRENILRLALGGEKSWRSRGGDS